MVRQARVKSESGFYHVVLRGNGRQTIFYDDEDRREFLRLLRRAADIDSIQIVAWCLMDNHVHLLLSDVSDHLSSMMHRFSSMYARYINAKTGHVGALFEGRFKSKALETEAYLLQAVRYIHDNPQAFGCARDSYKWSSYREYTGDAKIADTGMLLDLLGGKDAFTRFSVNYGDDDYAFEGRPGRQDEDAANEAVFVLRGIRPDKVKELPAAERDRCLKRLRAAGFSIRTIERLTGVGRYHIGKMTGGA
ncbi:transposase [Collinsella sp. An2]|uniref:transposase n=1 Tax=Collinsella sp. An2 TaxID=1965585 RepID=UPI00194E64BC|nr:transposase [Collinsella sp. An2]